MSDGTNNKCETSAGPAHICRAEYPIPPPLSRLLSAAILEHQDAQVETLEESLTQLVGNSFEAMDSMYFAR